MYNRQAALRLLLHFLSQLEMHVYSASEGSVSITAVSTTSVRFFRQNKKVCEDWFARLRKTLTTASVVAGSPFHLIEHATKRLPELCKQVAKSMKGGEVDLKLRGELDSLVLSLCEAMRELRDADAIDGFASWAKVRI